MPDRKLRESRGMPPSVMKVALMSQHRSKPSLSLYSPSSGEDGHAEQSASGESLTDADSVKKRRQQRELETLSGTAEPKTVAISLAQIVPLLIDAKENNRAWLADFANDSVRIDADLYEVLLAYQQLQQRAA